MKKPFLWKFELILLIELEIKKKSRNLLKEFLEQIELIMNSI